MIATPPSTTPLIDVAGLSVSFGQSTVVHGVDLSLHAGECLAIVGESGSGKSVTARALLGLAGPNAEVRAERLELLGTDRLGASERAWRGLRGREIGLVLQDALVSLDPLRPIGREIGDAIRLHENPGAAETHARVLRLLERGRDAQPRAGHPPAIRRAQRRPAPTCPDRGGAGAEPSRADRR